MKLKRKKYKITNIVDVRYDEIKDKCVVFWNHRFLKKLKQKII